MSAMNENTEIITTPHKYPPFGNAETIKDKLRANGHHEVADKTDLAEKLALQQLTPEQLTNMIEGYFPTMDISARCQLGIDLVKKN